MNPDAMVFIAAIVVGLPTIMLMMAFNRFFKFREKKLEVEARNAAENAAQYASRSTELEQRVRVLEQIVTDRGAKPPRRSKRCAPAAVRRKDQDDAAA